MSKSNIVKALQKAESEAWEDLCRYEFEQMSLCTLAEEMKWHETDAEYKQRLYLWCAIDEVLEKFEIKRVNMQKASDYASRVWRRNSEYRKQLKAGV